MTSQTILTNDQPDNTHINNKDTRSNLISNLKSNTEHRARLNQSTTEPHPQDTRAGSKQQPLSILKKKTGEKTKKM